MEIQLDKETREGLRVRHRREKNGRTRDRIKALLLADKGWTYKKIAEALLIDEETVSQHIHEYVERGKLEVETGGSFSKLGPMEAAELRYYLEHTTYMKVQDICGYVKATYGISYTVGGMTSWLKNNGFSYKKPKGTPSKADPVQQEAFIKKYEKMIRETPEDEPILFGNGVHPTMATKITYGWIRRGTNKLIATTGSRTRMNIMGALNLEDMEVIACSYDTLNSQAMDSYFGKIRETYPEAPKIHLILDNGPYNKSIETKKAAIKHGIVLHYLPPYSPNLNPSERLWKVMNEYVRNNQFFNTAKEFREAITYFFEETWPTIAFSMTDRINDNFQRLKSPISS